MIGSTAIFRPAHVQALLETDSRKLVDAAKSVEGKKRRRAKSYRQWPKVIEMHLVVFQTRITIYRKHRAWFGGHMDRVPPHKRASPSVSRSSTPAEPRWRAGEDAEFGGRSYGFVT